MDTPVITPAAPAAPAQKKGFGDILGSALGGFARGASGALSVLSPPAALVGGIVDSDLPNLSPDTSLAGVTRYFAAYNLVCGPVVDEENHLLGAVTVDDVLDHLLPHDWRLSADEPELPAGSGASGGDS